MGLTYPERLSQKEMFELIGAKNISVSYTIKHATWFDKLLNKIFEPVAIEIVWYETFTINFYMEN